MQVNQPTPTSGLHPLAYGAPILCALALACSLAGLDALWVNALMLLTLLSTLFVIFRLQQKNQRLVKATQDIASSYDTDHTVNLGEFEASHWPQLQSALNQWHQDTINSRFYMQALDACQGNIMVADEHYDIVYRNESLYKMFKSNEQVLQKSLTRLSVDKLVGSNMDIFHQHPEHQRKLMDKLTTPYCTRFVIEGLSFRLTATPLFKDDQRIGTVVEWLDMTEQVAKTHKEHMLAAENTRLKQALDCVSACTMVADNDNRIIYTNDALQTMFEDAEEDVRTGLPNFNAKQLVGEHIDVFHKNPSHQHNVIAALKTTHRAEFAVGSRVFKFTANPIQDGEDNRIGTVVEWEDRTAEVMIEKELNQLLAAANEGDLSQRLSLEGKAGFFLSLSKGLNQLLTVSDNILSDVVKLFDALARGDLSRQLDGTYSGQFNKLQQDANTTVERLTEVLSEISDAANTVTSSAEEITQGNIDLSQRTEEQAASLEETAASMEQMTATVKQSENNALIANNLAIEANQKAEQGGNVVKQAVVAMDAITESSKRIADIITVIDEIAFQTNLLALNAAVEAARAGEQGRGFAVVAGEVRNLAQRSAGAAKEIKELIRDSVNKVTDGTQLVNQSGETLKDIMLSVSKVAEMIAHISIAAEEQSSGIFEVNKSISQMDQMTQQNAALVEEIAAAGDTMTEQARQMKRKLSFFNTGNAFMASDTKIEQKAKIKHMAIQVSNEDWQEF